MATLDTPRRKDYGVDAETLLARWRVEAAAAGFDARRFEACFGRAAVEAVTDTQVARLYERLGGPAGLTERASTFVRTDVIESIANAVGGSCTAREVEQLADRFLASAHVVAVGAVQISTETDFRSEQAKLHRGSPTQYLYTTRELALIEADLSHHAGSDHQRSTSTPASWPR